MRTHHTGGLPCTLRGTRHHQPRTSGAPLRAARLMIGGTLEPFAALYPDDLTVQLIAQQFTGLQATLTMLADGPPRTWPGTFRCPSACSATKAPPSSSDSTACACCAARHGAGRCAPGPDRALKHAASRSAARPRRGR